MLIKESWYFDSISSSQCWLFFRFWANWTLKFILRALKALLISSECSFDYILKFSTSNLECCLMKTSPSFKRSPTFYTETFLNFNCLWTFRLCFLSLAFFTSVMILSRSFLSLSRMIRERVFQFFVFCLSISKSSISLWIGSFILATIFKLNW